MSTSVTACTPLPPQFQQHPGDGSGLKAEYIQAIEDAIRNAPRSLQELIGPSEVGIPCTRLLGYKLLKVPERPRVVNWKAAVGTGGHLLMEDVFDRYNKLHYELLGYNERFYIETRVSVGEVNGIEIEGSSDIYDRVTGTVIDHKFPGKTILEKYRRTRNPGQQYRDQAHLYGRGWQRAGLPVNRVMIAFLPRDGELDDHYIWSEAYDEQVALRALQRVTGVDVAIKALGSAALELLPTHNHYCHLCPYLKRHSTNLLEGCPGDEESNIAKPQPSSSELLGSGRK